MKKIIYQGAFALSCLSLTLSAFAMSEPDAKRLLSRSGFEASNAQTAKLAATNTRDASFDLVRQAKLNTQTVALPAWVGEAITPLRSSNQMSEEARQQWRMKQNQNMQQLRAWWFEQMLTTPTPLREKMVLFWHNHFVSSQYKVVNAHLMQGQHALFRQHALGNFAQLLGEILQDPAMIIYLDAAQNRYQAPNENLARELMELFTLGEGAYSEADVKEAARALTGLSVDPESNRFQYLARLHDIRSKTVLGKPVGNAVDLVKVLLAQPRAAEYIVEKAWREFISSTPDSKEVKRIAAVFRQSGYEIAPMMSELLASPALYSEQANAGVVKSPVDLIMSTLRQFDIKPPDMGGVMLASAGMGQILFAPPNVKGWPPGNAWINANTLLVRKQFAARAFGIELNPALAKAMQNSAMDGMNNAELPARFRVRPNQGLTQNAPSFDAKGWLSANGFPPEQTLYGAARGNLMKAVLFTAPAVEPDTSLEGLPLLAHLLLDPAFQVK